MIDLVIDLVIPCVWDWCVWIGVSGLMGVVWSIESGIQFSGRKDGKMIMPPMGLIAYEFASHSILSWAGGASYYLNEVLIAYGLIIIGLHYDNILCHHLSNSLIDD